MDAAVAREKWQGLEELRGVLRAVLSRHCLDENEAEDVIQETYLRAARYRDNLNAGARLRPWMVRIALNVLADGKRRRSRCQPAPPEEACMQVADAPGPYDELEAPFRLGRWELEKETALELMTHALRELKRADQRVLASYYGGSQSCRETAKECDIPLHLVKVRLFRARRRLLRGIRGLLARGAARP